MSAISRFNPRRIWRGVQMIEPLRQQVGREHKDVLRELRGIHQTLQRLERKLAAHDEALAAHDGALAVLPEVQERVERCRTAYQKDMQFADRLASFQALVNPEHVRAHVQQAITRARLETDPCPYVVLDRIVPDEVYDALVEALPSPVFFKKSSVNRAEITVPFPFAPAYSRTAWGLFYDVVEQTILPALVDMFRPALDEFVRKSWPSLGSWTQSGLSLEVAHSRMMLRRAGYHIKPHRDPRWAFLTAIFYLAPRDTEQLYGTQFYRLKVERDEAHSSPLWAHPDECELVRDVSGIGNSAVVFLNSTGVHGASIPEDAPEDFLRYVYQVQFSPNEAMRARLVELLDAGARARWTSVADKAQ